MNMNADEGWMEVMFTLDSSGIRFCCVLISASGGFSFGWKGRSLMVEKSKVVGIIHGVVVWDGS